MNLVRRAWANILRREFNIGQNALVRRNPAEADFELETFEPRLLLSVTPMIASITPDTGSSSTDGITSATVLTLAGTADPSATVSLADTKTQLGTTTATAAGGWSFTTPTLAQGSHSFTAAASGLTSAASPVTVDTTPPAAPTINALTTPSYKPAPTLTGTAEANATITVYDGQAAIGTSQVTSTGSWSFTPTSLGGGLHSFTTTATDAAGNVSAMSVASATVRITTLTLTVSGDIYQGGPQFTVFAGGKQIGGTYTTTAVHDNNQWSTVTVMADMGLNGPQKIAVNYINDIGGSTHATDRNLYVGSLNLDGAITNGANWATNTAEPVSGRTLPNASVMVFNGTVTYNVTAPPATPLVNALPALTKNTVPTISGLANAGTTVTIYNGTSALGTAQAASSGAWSYTPASALAPATYSISAFATNTNGVASLSSAAQAMTVKTSAPAPFVNFLPSLVNTTTPAVSGTGEAGDTISVYDGAALLGTTLASSTGIWSLSPTLASGAHSITATATDPAGNLSPTSNVQSFIVNTAAPAAPNPPMINAPAALTNNTKPTLTGTADAGTTVTVYDGATGLGSTQAGGAGTWSFTPAPPLANGVHSFVAVETNTLGTTSAGSAPRTVTINTVPPAAPVLNAIASPSYTNTPTLTGSAVGNATVAIFDGAAQLGTAQASSTGAWSYTPSAPLAGGTHVFTATATDAYGNVSAASAATAPLRITTLVLTVSGDSWNGAPTFTVAVNGHQVGGTYTTSAVHAQNQWSTVTLTGDFGLNGPTSVAITYTNDASSGVAGQDRNMYVQSVAVDGKVTNGANFTSNTASAGYTSPTEAKMIVGGSVTYSVVAPPWAPSVNVLPAATRNPAPTIAGSAPAGATVSVYAGGSLLGSTAATSSGAWSFTPASALADGVYAIRATDTNANGTSIASATQTITVKTSAPAPAIGALASLTSNTTPAITGTAEANDTVTIYDGTTQLGTTIATNAGAWNFTPASALAAGIHNFTATATDPLGNVSAASAAQSLTVKTSAPAPVIATLASPTKNNTPAIIGTAEANDTVTVYDGTTQLGTTVASGAGAWSFTPASALADGTHSFTVTATDSLGNVSPASAAQSVTIDTAAPAAPVIAALASPTANNSPPITGVAEAGTTVTVYDGTGQLGTTVATGAASWSFTPSPLADGTHSITATATDLAGNVSPASAQQNLTIKTSAPAPVIVTLVSPTRNNRLTITGTAEANDTVTIYDGTTQLGTTLASAAGAWSFTPASPLADGTHSFTATATDSVGNVSGASAAQSVTVDTVAPAAPAIASLGPALYISNPTLNGTAEAFSTVQVYLDSASSAAASTLANAQGAWSVTLAGPLADGTHSFAATATDAAGNVSPLSASMSVIVSATPVTWIGGASGAWNNPANWSSGAVPGAYANVNINAGAGTTITIGASTTVGQFVSNATLVISGGLTVNGAVTNSGSINLQQGNLQIAAGLTNAGGIEIGSTSTVAVAGTLTLQPASALQFDVTDVNVGGSMTVGGAAQLAGTVTIGRPATYAGLPISFTPAMGNGYTLMSFGAAPAGSVAGVNLSLNNGSGFSLAASASAMTATVVNTTANAWYVDPTAPGGGNGSQASPFNSVAQLPATTGNLNATIYFKRGTIDHEELDLNLASNFVLDAYGTGTMPIIDASSIVATAWVQEGSLWYLPNVSATVGVFANGTELVDVAAKSSMQTGQAWFDQADNRMYVNLANAANPNQQLMEVTARNFAVHVTDSYGFTIQNLQFQRAVNGGFSIGAGWNGATAVTPSNVMVRGNVFNNNGSWATSGIGNDGFHLQGYSAAQPGSGIVVQQNQSLNNVNCAYELSYLNGAVVQDNLGNGDGQGIELWFGDTNSVFTRNVIENIQPLGTSVGHGNGIWLTNTGIAPGCGGFANLVIDGNEFINTWQDGWEVGDGTNIQLSQNLVANCGVSNLSGSGSMVVMAKLGTNPVSYTMYNNIFYNSTGHTISAFKSFANLGGPAVINNNDYWCTAGGHFGYVYNGLGYGNWTTGFTDYQTKSGQDSQGMNVDPGFVNAAAGDYDLSTTSPLLRKGSTNISIRLGIDLNAFGSPPPIGPYAVAGL